MDGLFPTYGYINQFFKFCLFSYGFFGVVPTVWVLRSSYVRVLEKSERCGRESSFLPCLYVWLRVAAFSLRVLQCSQMLMGALVSVVAIFSASSLTIVWIAGSSWSCSVNFPLRLDERYWLMAAWVVPSFCAALVWDRWCSLTSLLAMSARSVGRTCLATISHWKLMSVSSVVC